MNGTDFLLNGVFNVTGFSVTPTAQSGFIRHFFVNQSGFSNSRTLSYDNFATKVSKIPSPVPVPASVFLLTSALCFVGFAGHA